MTTTLPEFILARVAEWEVAASKATPGQWTRYGLTKVGGSTGTYWQVAAPEPDLRGQDLARVWTAKQVDADHIAAHDPARVLAQCAAYRRIVEDFETLHEDYRTTHDRTTEARRLQAAISLGHLAAIWADRADYDERWRP